MNRNLDASTGKILIVDDQQINLRTIELLLTETPLEIIKATNGHDAIEIVKNDDKLDLILLDLVMPDISGIEVCKKIRETRSLNELPILILTGSDDEETVSEAFLAGGNSFIVKPVKKGELIARLNTHLRLRRIHQSLQKSNAELALRNQEKDKLFSILAHDLRSPLSGISGMMEILTEGIDEIPPEELKEIHKELHTATRNLMLKLEDLLDWAHWKTTSKDEVNEEFILSVLLDEIESKIQENLNQRQSKITRELSITSLYSHRTSILSLIKELLSNAIRFSPRNSKLTIKIYGDHDSFTIEVIDQGPGIPEDVKKEILEGKTIRSSLGSEGEHGTGIGLIWVREIVALLSGTLSITNLDEGGCKVTCQCPVLK